MLQDHPEDFLPVDMAIEVLAVTASPGGTILPLEVGPVSLDAIKFVAVLAKEFRRIP